MKSLYHDILVQIGEDPTRLGLKDTPRRAEEAMRTLTQGYQQSLDSILQGSLYETDSKDLVILKNIDFYSLCEHHLLPFFGQCHIGYIPKGRVIGLSKISRLVEHFSRRLQIQEQLTADIAHALMQATGAYGVGVVMEAKHFCMMLNEPRQQQSHLTTTSMLGIMLTDSKISSNFFQLIK